MEEQKTKKIINSTWELLNKAVNFHLSLFSKLLHSLGSRSGDNKWPTWGTQKETNHWILPISLLLMSENDAMLLLFHALQTLQKKVSYGIQGFCGYCSLAAKMWPRPKLMTNGTNKPTLHYHGYALEVVDS